jgi:UDP-glucuronate decarboxylase
MNIIVTGGTGFIGSHLCKILLNQRHYVICIDNNFTGSLDNISELLHLSNFRFIEHDIVNPIYFDDIQIHQIYHLACPASPKAYQSDPIYTIKTNTHGTLNILGLAKQHQSRILLTSTSEIYGDPHISPQIEEYWGNVNSIGIRSCYDEGKRIAETLMMEYHRMHNVDIRISRLFNTYGPFMNKDDGRVVSNFINQCLENKDITIYGNGSQTRSFCYIDDTVDAIIKLMNQNETIGPINIGNPNEITVKELSEMVVSLLPNSTSKIIYTTLPNDDPKKRKPCINKAKQYLLWEPKIILNDGLIKTINYFTEKKEI